MTASAHGRPAADSTNRLALSATIHCLTGCSIGEVLGMVAGAAFHWPNLPTVIVSIALAFVFGYSLTLSPLLRAGLAFPRAAALAFASDTLSITIMEIVDNAIMLAVPGAMDAHPGSGLFWGSMIGSLVAAGVAAFPVNRWLIARGQGHSLVHDHHTGAHAGHAGAPNAREAHSHGKAEPPAGAHHH